MKFYPDRLMVDRNQSSLWLNIISIAIMLTAIGIFIYFFISGNFHIHYIIAVGCLLLFICGVFMGLSAYLLKTENSIELTFEKTSKQVKRFGWLSLGASYVSSICLSAGLIFLAQQGDVWRNSIILFSGSILSLVIGMFGLIQRKITKQHYELKKQQQEIIEMLSDQKLKKTKDISGGVLLA